MRFSDRTAWNLAGNPWSARVAAKRQAGVPLLDLTDSNPTRCDFDYTHAGLEALADPAARHYRPAARGAPAARDAVAAYYAAHGIAVDPGAVILTASTSEAYSYLFKLLADPGDTILAPTPSYPLFDYLAGLDGVRLVPYPLRYDGAWFLDFAALAAALPARARAVILVHPHNPTGVFLKTGERDRLVAFCRAHDLAIICDEVFLDYGYAPDPARAPSLAGTTAVLTATLSGLSKLAGLPQVKAGWMVLSGPAAVREEALRRAEVIADTYLSVSTPVQLALPRLLESGAALRAQIRARLRANRATLDRLLAGDQPLQALPAEGGWYATLQVPALRTEEAWTLTLLEADDLLVHPGYFFDFPSGCLLVLSLLPPPAVFTTGVTRLIARVAAVVAAPEDDTPARAIAPTTR
ncbi:MAG TPA: pyridoxal phosphate-dependent aminotransferase [Chloroflexia bacterium]|nr:pyridoxal phosphate-dependent aminotransferase [Chloroflexia bacterium]